MSYKAVHLICDEDLEETLSFLLQESGYEGSSYEKGRLIAYCSSEEYDEKSLYKILSNFNLIPEKITDVANENWNVMWEENFKEARIGDHIQARAPFHPSSGARHDIIISPKMAFGTGHHETTQLTAISLEKLDCKDKQVLDMGCGSGLLAILASQKGANRVLAIDYDANCVQNTKENIQLNKAKNVDVLQADSVSQLTEKFDIIVSNIVKNINLRLLPEFVARLNKDGHLILCGFLDQDLDELKKAATAQGLKLVEQNIDNNWLQTQFIHE
ncbi:MAG: 50S ribosomal protein L11 methyltransferase [Bacteroidetes bacterium]|nr:MAG: 50S ribosomal protein L11 methyltransferase [Bacteroidota bacterium]